MKQIDVSLIVNEAISEQLGVKLENITDEATMEHLGGDSLDTVELDMLIEEMLDETISLQETPTENETTVAELTAKVKNLVEAI